MDIIYRKENLLIIDNFYDNFDVDPNEFYSSELYQRRYDFPDQHDHFIIDQYDPTPKVKQLGELAVDKLKSVVDDFPLNHKLTTGAHEIKYHGVNGMGAIPPHSDRGHYCGITICVNREWLREWGGWNFTFESDNIKTTEPKFNRAIIIFAPNLHGCVPVWEKDKCRRTLQFFIDDVDHPEYGIGVR